MCHGCARVAHTFLLPTYWTTLSFFMLDVLGFLSLHASLPGLTRRTCQSRSSHWLQSPERMVIPVFDTGLSQGEGTMGGVHSV